MFLGRIFGTYPKILEVTWAVLSFEELSRMARGCRGGSRSGGGDGERRTDREQFSELHVGGLLHEKTCEDLCEFFGVYAVS